MTYTHDQVAWPIRAVVNLQAYKDNLRRMRLFAPRCQQMAIVKANAYGHGIGRISLAALEAGAQWLGVAKVAEACRLREFLDRQGIARDHLSDTPIAAVRRSRLPREQIDFPTPARPRILSWIYTPDTDLKKVISGDIDLSVSTLDQLDQVSRAADQAGSRARIHLKVDTGLSRAGCLPEEFPVLCKLARARERSGLVEVSAVWSHFARADEPQPEAEAFTKKQLEVFKQGFQVAQEAGLVPLLRHIAASGAILWYPESHFEMVRVGIAAYGLSPNPTLASSASLGLRPVMRLETNVLQVKRIETGQPVSYGGEWVAPCPTWLALLPIGYADGIFRLAKDRGEVWINGRLARIVGRVPMDQVIVEIGPALDEDGNNLACPAQPGDLAIIFGDSTRPVADFGEDPVPSADDLAAASHTISYEVLTAVRESTPRVYVEE